MGFLESYKRLDNLIKNRLHTPTGISEYITRMDTKSNSSHGIAGWWDDYKRLKHYRYVRNRLVHDDDAFESDLCSLEDIQWLESFSRRIMSENDPLSILNSYIYVLPMRYIRPENNESQKVKTSGCYIATSVYGSYDCPEVWTLRRFRDLRLAKTWYGRAFINAYYKVSPFIVRNFGKSKIFNSFFRWYLDLMVENLKKQGFKDTRYYN